MKLSSIFMTLKLLFDDSYAFTREMNDQFLKKVMDSVLHDE